MIEPTPVLLPQMGLEVSAATVLALLAEVGDAVSEGQPLLEVETDKATTDVLAPCGGFVVAIEVAGGDEVPVGAVVAYVGASADARPSGTRRPAPVAADGAPVATANAAAASAGDAAVSTVLADGRWPRSAPVARRAAASLGIELATIAGSGPRGRITLGDVERAAASALPASPASQASGAAAAATPAPWTSAPAADAGEPLSKVRRVTARRMTQSQLIPQYRLERDVDATHLLAQKAAVAAGAGAGPRPGVNDLLIQAIAATVREHPALATSWVEDPEPALRRHESIGVGLAVASERGLVVPVIPAADVLGLGQIAAERARLVDAARAGRLAPTEMTGAAITLSNLGGFGVDRFTAMLNPGESAIVAVGRVVERVVPRGRGLAVVPILTVTATFDHRTVDGAVGGAALAALAELLEGRMTWRP